MLLGGFIALTPVEPLLGLWKRPCGKFFYFLISSFFCCLIPKVDFDIAAVLFSRLGERLLDLTAPE